MEPNVVRDTSGTRKKENVFVRIIDATVLVFKIYRIILLNLFSFPFYISDKIVIFQLVIRGTLDKTVRLFALFLLMV